MKTFHEYIPPGRCGKNLNLYGSDDLAQERPWQNSRDVRTRIMYGTAAYLPVKKPTLNYFGSNIAPYRNKCKTNV
jgi:hypothetical protein